MNDITLIDVVGRKTFQKIAIRQVIWWMALWSGFDSFERALTYFKIRENFEFAWKHSSFQHYYSSALTTNLPHLVRASLFKAPRHDAWPNAIPKQKERPCATDDDHKEIVRGIKLRLRQGLDISQSFLQTKNDLNYQSSNWHLACRVPKDLLTSIERNGRCVNEEGNLHLLCRQFGLTAEVFCKSEQICHQVNYQLRLNKMSKEHFAVHINNLEVGAALIALRLYHHRGISDVANAAHIKPSRYLNFEKGVEKVTRSLFRKIIDIYPKSVELDLLINC